MQDGSSQGWQAARWNGICQVRRAVPVEFQLSTDGFACYRNAVYSAFGESVDYAQSIKTYAQTEEPQRRYSPAKIVTVENKPIYGNPKEERICTSHIERQNGSLCSVVQAAHAFDLRVLQEDGEPSRGAGATLRVL